MLTSTSIALIAVVRSGHWRTTVPNASRVGRKSDALLHSGYLEMFFWRARERGGGRAHARACYYVMPRRVTITSTPECAAVQEHAVVSLHEQLDRVDEPHVVVAEPRKAEPPPLRCAVVVAVSELGDEHVCHLDAGAPFTERRRDLFMDTLGAPASRWRKCSTCSACLTCSRPHTHHGDICEWSSTGNGMTIAIDD